MVKTKVDLCGIELDNPVIPASGTFGYGHEFADIYDINILGSFSFKGTTKEARFGNDTPRIAETASGMLNSVGLQNPGIEAVLNNEIPLIQKVFNKKVMANIGGFSIDEYVYCCQRINECENVGWVELNVSCPNVHCGGMSFGTTTEGVSQVVKAVKKVLDKPLIVKLTPNVTDIASIAKAAESEGADGISLINTLLGMRIDLKTRKPLLANVTGGLSGPSVLPIALRMVYQVYNTVKIPIVGMGGVSSASDVIEMMLAGATAVQVGAANLVNPFACKEIITQLPEKMNELNITNLKDIIGGAY